MPKVIGPDGETIVGGEGVDADTTIGADPEVVSRIGPNGEQIFKSAEQSPQPSKEREAA